MMDRVLLAAALALGLGASQRSDTLDPKAEWHALWSRLMLPGRLESLIGRHPVQCGTVWIDDLLRSSVDVGALRKALACASSATDARRPFQFVVYLAEVDSQPAYGLIGDASGDVFRFGYDSAPCGSPSLRPPCAPRFATRPCPRPAMSEHDGYADLICGPAPTTPGPPSRRRPAP